MKKPVSLNKLELFEKLQQNLAFALSHTTPLIGFVLALVASLASPALAQTRFTSNTIIITGSRGLDKISPARYYTNSSDGTSSRPFDGQDLGDGVAFIRDQTRVDSLFVNAEANTFTNSGDNIQSVRLLYRVYPTNTPPADAGSQIPLNLNPVSVTASGQGKWSYLTNKTNLINFATADANYTLEVAFEGNYTSTANGVTTSGIITDDKGGARYKATFQVKAYSSAYTSLTWKAGNKSKDWFDSNNWSLGSVPTAYTDVVIPYQSGGTYPAINRSDNGIARVHNLTIVGRNSDTSLGARLTLTQGSLYIYGDFRDLNAGFSQTGIQQPGGSPPIVGYLVLAGQTQLFDASPALLNLTITGGGTKTIPGIITIQDSLRFLPGSDGLAAGLLSTGLSNAGKYAVSLIKNAVLRGETEGAYVKGTVTITRALAKGIQNTFGGIGLDLTVDRDISSVSVVRSSAPYTGVGTSVSIVRGFSINPSDSDPVNVDLTFHYLNDELNMIAPQNLRLFSSETGDIPFVALNKTSADPTTAKTLTLNGFNSSLLNIFTLGDAANPLPVTLISFTATPTAQGAALLRWATATETNNRGFSIERQLGTSEAWQSVGFVAAGATTGSKYEFTDKSLVNAPASTQAYYRLRQEDLDGKVTYSPVAVINRTGVVAATELTLSPVPVGGTDNLSVGLAEAGQAGIMVAVTNTQGQRVLSLTTQASTDAALSLPVTSLAAGVYIVTVQVPGQAARHARFVKM